MTTKLDICNSVLIRTGNEIVDNLTDNSKRLKVLLKQYDLTLGELLNDTTWNFATDRSILLNIDSTPPAFGFSNRYSIPSNVIRILEIERNERPYRVEGKFLLTNSDVPQIKAKCIVLVDNPLLWSESFKKAFILKLAEDISYSLVQSVPLKAEIAADADKYLRRARSYNSQEGTPLERLDIGYEYGVRL